MNVKDFLFVNLDLLKKASLAVIGSIPVKHQKTFLAIEQSICLLEVNTSNIIEVKCIIDKILRLKFELSESGINIPKN